MTERVLMKLNTFLYFICIKYFLKEQLLIVSSKKLLCNKNTNIWCRSGGSVVLLHKEGSGYSTKSHFFHPGGKSDANLF